MPTYIDDHTKLTQVSALQSIAFLQILLFDSHLKPHTYKVKPMGIRVLGFIPAKQILPHSVLTTKNKEASTCADVPKGFLSVYVGENQKKRFLVPVSYLNQPLFQDLL